MRRISEMANGLSVISHIYRDHVLFTVMIVGSLFAAGYIFS